MRTTDGLVGGKKGGEERNVLSRVTLKQSPQLMGENGERRHQSVVRGMVEGEESKEERQGLTPDRTKPRTHTLRAREQLLGSESREACNRRPVRIEDVRCQQRAHS